MVKLFVGNLAPKVDSVELRKLFEQYGLVSECDVIRNYGFVHMDNEDEAKKAFQALNNYNLQGRSVHLEYSTSKLRKAPGMDEVCFRCGDSGHKTNNCPLHGQSSGGGGGGSRDMRHSRSSSHGGHSSKRPSTREDTMFPPPKRVECYYTPSREVVTAGVNYDYFAPPGTTTTTAAARSLSDLDPLIPRPMDRNLAPLYEDYLVARERYYYYRDRLEVELGARRAGVPGGPPVQPTAVVNPSLLHQARVAQAPPPGGAGAPPSAAYDYYGQPRASPPVARPDVYYTRTTNGYETVALPSAQLRTGYVAAAPAHPDVYYRRTENGYEAYTLPPAGYAI